MFCFILFDMVLGLAMSQVLPDDALAQPWKPFLDLAKQKIETLTVKEKVILVSGSGFGVDFPCVGNIGKVDSISFPGLCLQDGPTGVRYQNKTSSSFTASIALAATFDKDLMMKHAQAQGLEFRNKGANVALTPMMNIGRAAAAGRNWEGFGEDPYLASVAASTIVRGIQSHGVMATAKHFFGNEQEHFRQSAEGYSEIGERAMREIYLPPFQACVNAGVSSVMCAYNRLKTPNGELNFACAHETALNKILKKEMNFQGFVMSDWWAVKSNLVNGTDAFKAANNGLDMIMPGTLDFGISDLIWDVNLVNAVNDNVVPLSRLDNMATRVLAAWYRMGQDIGYPDTNFHSFDPSKDQNVDVKAPETSALIREYVDSQIHIRIGAASIVLLKNTNKTLPLKADESLIILGTNALAAKDPNKFPDRAGIVGHVGVGWGSGTTNFPYLVAPYDAIKARSSASVEYFENVTKVAYEAASHTDAVVVFVFADSGENYLTVNGNAGDRNNLLLWGDGDLLIESVLAIHSNIVVVVTAPGPIDMQKWIDEPKISAVLFATFLGQGSVFYMVTIQESGNAIADVLYGDVNPAGRLPFTIAKQVTDYPAQVVFEDPGIVKYTESIFVGYRWFDHANIQPLFEFGFGLSYTQFAYSGITLERSGEECKVSFDLKNVGPKDGHEVAQAYVQFPASALAALKNLKAFERIFLKAGETKRVVLNLDAESFKFWDESLNAWNFASGTYKIHVASSSRNTQLETSFNL